MAVKVRSLLESANTDRKNGYSERSVRKTISDIVARHKDDDVEHGYAINLDGKLIPHYDEDGNLVYDSVGVKGHCNIYGAEDAISIHNHPLREFGVFGGTFSDGDIRSMISRNEFMSVAYDQERVFILKKIGWKKGERSEDERFAHAYRNHADKLYKQIEDSVWSRMMNGEFRNASGKADLNLMSKATTSEWLTRSREWLRNHSKEYGYEYREYAIRGKK